MVNLGDEGVLIERSAENFYDGADKTKYTNYWMMLRDDAGMVGVLGIQVNIQSYEKLVPPVII